MVSLFKTRYSLSAELPPATEAFDDRVPVWPPDISAILYGRISNPDWHVPWHETQYMATRFGIVPSFAFGRLDPLSSLGHLTGIYRCLADKSLSDTQKRAENAILYMTTNNLDSEFLDRLPIGIAAPLREAARTCQLAPPGDWPLAAYQAIGRNDLAASVGNTPDALFKDGYKPRKEFIVRLPFLLTPISHVHLRIQPILGEQSEIS